jgi:phospholipase C
MVLSGAGVRRRRAAVLRLSCIAAVAAGSLLVGALLPMSGTARSSPASHRVTQQLTSALRGIHKIRHVIIIMQENRSFDSYFGTFPGANGIPRRNGVPTVCVPDPKRHRCVRPFVDNSDRNHGGPHDNDAATADINGGRMNGFIAQAETGHTPERARDVMGHHDARSIPNYWTYARRYVLQDRMFASSRSWSLPEHLFMVSEWSARCADRFLPNTCVNSLGHLRNSRRKYAWTDLTYLLHQQHVSWRYYVQPGFEPDCRDASERTCQRTPQDAVKPGPWNPLPGFGTVNRDGQRGNIKPLGYFFGAAKLGKLPAVTWIVPSAPYSEHPQFLVSKGQAYVTRLVNAVMHSPQWRSSAIFISWDDWGGMYDHVRPPNTDRNGYGLRVPGLLISPYARRGYVDHQTLSHDAYVKFIEDDFLNGQRINPLSDGRPDPRPNVRENDRVLGDLRHAFNFAQRPRRPLILKPYPR